MRSEQFRYFRVKNFKRFRDLEVNDIGRFNLILGDNNVGKTSLLEALMWGFSMKAFQEVLSQLLYQKYQGSLPSEHVIKHFLRISSENTYLNSMEFSVRTRLHTPKSSPISSLYEFDFSENSYTGVLNDSQPLSGELINHLISDLDLPLIPFSFQYDHKMVQRFSRFLGRNIAKRKKVVKSLSKLFDGVSNLETDNYTLQNHPTIRVWIEGKSETYPLEFFGDGFVKLFAILLKIIEESHNIVLIDEIDAGIHYSRQKDFWIGILDFANENNVQIFATTHNRECTEAYQQALDELGEDYQKDARTIRLVEHAQTKDIVSFTNSYEKMTEELLIGNEIR